MLTPDDDSADGRKLGYLNSPNRWRWRDPELFDALRLIVSGGQPRTVAAVEAAGVLKGAQFVTRMATRIGEHTGLRHVVAFRTAGVVWL